MYYAHVSDHNNYSNDYFETYDEAKHHMEHYGCIETPFTYDSEKEINEVYRPCSVTCFVKESDLPDNFNDLPEDKRERIMDKVVDDGAYCPYISEFSGSLSDYFGD